MAVSQGKRVNHLKILVLMWGAVRDDQSNGQNAVTINLEHIRCNYYCTYSHRPWRRRGRLLPSLSQSPGKLIESAVSSRHFVVPAVFFVDVGHQYRHRRRRRFSLFFLQS